MSDLDLERAKRTLRAYGVPFGEGGPCADGCPSDRFVTAGPVALAGDLWTLEACGRCLRGRAKRAGPANPLPTSVAQPDEVWVTARGIAHRVFRSPRTDPQLVGLPYPLRSACGHGLGWSDTPTWALRMALAETRLHRCQTCSGAQLHLAAVQADEPSVWQELVARAAEALRAAGHPVPWEKP